MQGIWGGTGSLPYVTSGFPNCVQSLPYVTSGFANRVQSLRYVTGTCRETQLQLVVEGITAATVLLGVVESLVSAVEEAAALALIIRKSNTGADGDLGHVLLRHIGKLLVDGVDLSCDNGLVLARRIDHDHGKLIATNAAHEVIAAKRRHKQCRHVLQDLVAADVTAGIVNILELIDITQDESCRLPACLARIKNPVKEPAIE